MKFLNKLSPTLDLESGGTGVSTPPVAGSVIYGASATAYASTAAGTQDQLLVSNGVGAPSWASRVRNVQIFTASGTWTEPSGLYSFVRVRLVGGGGGGSGGTGAASGQAQGAGGGGGGYCEQVYPIAQVNATESVVVGAGGAGATGATAGTTGGNSTFRTLVGNGGLGGAAGFTAATSSGACLGGAGGAASNGNVLNIKGYSGGNGRTLLGVSIVASFGGASQMAGQTNQSLSSAVDGPSGSLYGGGGAGGYVAVTSRSGGAGAAGVVIIETW